MAVQTLLERLCRFNMTEDASSVPSAKRQRTEERENDEMPGLDAEALAESREEEEGGAVPVFKDLHVQADSNKCVQQVPLIILECSNSCSTAGALQN